MAKEQKLSVAQEEAGLEAQLAELRRTKGTRAVIEAIDAGWIPQGTRLVDPVNPEEGRVIVFTPEEAAAVVGTLRKIATARIEGAAK